MSEGQASSLTGPIRGILVPYDGSARAERALAFASSFCRSSRACLGIAVLQPRIVAFASPWVHVPGVVFSQREACGPVLRRVPQDVSVRFLFSPIPAGASQIADFARRLGCDAVLVPQRGRAGRRMAKALSKRGLTVFLVPEQQAQTRRSAEAPASSQLSSLPALEPAR
jgi:nucleotide-binding universal stress UspA family protein